MNDSIKRSMGILVAICLAAFIPACSGSKTLSSSKKPTVSAASSRLSSSGSSSSPVSSAVTSAVSSESDSSKGTATVQHPDGKTAGTTGKSTGRATGGGGTGRTAGGRGTTGGGATGGGTGGGETIVPTGIITKAYGATYGAENQAQYDTIWRDACGVTSWSRYQQGYAYAKAHPDDFTTCYGVPYSDAMNKALSIIGNFPRKGGSPSTGNAYRAYTGQGTACGDVAKAREAALHAAGIPCRLVWSSSHMWIEFTVNGTTYQKDNALTTYDQHSVAGKGYNYG